MSGILWLVKRSRERVCLGQLKYDGVVRAGQGHMRLGLESEIIDKICLTCIGEDQDEGTKSDVNLGIY